MPELDPIRFLRATPPFDRVSPERFARLAQALEIRFVPAGTRLLGHGDAPLEHVLVIRKGAVRLERDGRVVQLLEEGDPIGLVSLLTRTTPLDVIVEEDLLAYALPRPVVEPLLAEPAFAAHFASALGERLAASLAPLEEPAEAARLATPIGGLVARALATIGRDATVGEAARRMRDEGVSALIIAPDGPEPAAILTERDLRNRVLAEGRGPDALVGAVCSAPLVTVDRATALHEAWEVAIERGVRHLPVTDEGRVLGMVTATDLLRHRAHGPVALARSIDRLVASGRLGDYGVRLDTMVRELFAGGLEPLRIAGLVSRVDDALVRTLVAAAQRELGPPPRDFAWLVVGSAGRREQTLQTDQDHALVYADPPPDASPEEEATAATWFGRLAEHVVVGLEAAGSPRCPGGMMATRWCGTVATWQRWFAEWIDAPTPEALLWAATFWDFRRVAGALEPSPLDAVVARAAGRTTFLRCLAKAAVEHRPRTGLALRLRGGASIVDLKREALTPLVMLARCHALEVGSSERPTLARITAAERAGLLDRDSAAGLAHAFVFLLELRLQRHLAGAGPELRMDELRAPERRALKDALAVVREWQDVAAYHYQTDLV